MPVENPLVSVVMSVNEGAAHLPQSLASILNQSFDDFEFIIVNDGSTDESGAILGSWASRDDRIRLVDQPKQGLTKALNVAIARARGKWIARQDADDISAPTRLQQQLSFLERQPGVGVVGTAVKTIGRQGETLGIGERAVQDADIRFELLRHNPLTHGSVMFSKELFSAVGGYDERLAYAQDYDLWWRMSRVAALANLSAPLYCWRKRPDSISSRRETEQAIAADRISQRNCLEAIRSLVSAREVGQERPTEEVSVVIPTKDRHSDVVRCLCHVLMQTVRPREIVVVDASSDDSVSRMAERNLGRWLSRVRVLRTSPGLTRQKNVGIRESKGNIILFLDDDIVLYPNFVEMILQTFNKEPGPIGGVMGDIVNSRAYMERRYQAVLKRLLFSYGFGDGTFKRSGASTAPYGLSTVKEVEFLCGGQTAWKREVCEEFQFDEFFPDQYCYCEDVEFSYRVSRKYRNYYTPYARSFHNNKTPLRTHHSTAYRAMRMRNHRHHFRKNVPKNPLNVAAFTLCMFYLRHEPAFYRAADILEYVGKRWRADPKLEVSAYILLAVMRRCQRGLRL